MLAASANDSSAANSNANAYRECLKRLSIGRRSSAAGSYLGRFSVLKPDPNSRASFPRDGTRFDFYLLGFGKGRLGDVGEAFPHSRWERIVQSLGILIVTWYFPFCC